METDYKKIIGHEKVIAILDKWPSFHDAEVLSVTLERDERSYIAPPQMKAVIHAFRLEVSPGDPSRNNCLVSMQFRGIEELKLADFNNQNAINGISLSTHWSERLRCEVFNVRFLPGFGLGCEFQCNEIEVLSVQPIAVEGR